MSSVALPEGTLITTWRGAAIISTSRSIGSATAMRPSFSASPAISVATASVRFQATTSWPPRAARRAMPAPILPSPAIPTCMLLPTFECRRSGSPGWPAASSRHPDGRVDHRLQPLESRVEIAEVQPQGAPAATLERGEVAQRLGRDERAEGLLPPRDRKVLRRIGGELEEDASVRPSLVELTGRVQEP